MKNQQKKIIGITLTPEDIERMRELEAAEWIKRRKEKMRTVGSTEALQWWQDHLTVMEKIRGASATLDLRQRIKRQMNEN